MVHKEMLGKVEAHYDYAAFGAVIAQKGFCARGRMSWHEYNIYSKTYTEGSDPNAANLRLI